VRGTTSLQVCSMAREAGAKVYFANSSSPVTYTAPRSLLIIYTKLLSSHPYIYSTELATPTELVACKRDRKTIAASINADGAVYLASEDLEAAYAELSPRVDQRFEVGVFCGRYVTPVS
jgi:amidophosphoribosyltransferase